MNSLFSNRFHEGSGTHETMADLVFCALVVLLLFILALTVEVSQRVRAASKAEESRDVKEMTQEDLNALLRKLKRLEKKVESLQSGGSGRQRFTGARQPAALSIAYDYSAKRYLFVPSEDVDHADRQLSGETSSEFLGRKLRELSSIAKNAKHYRGYTEKEVNSILQSFSQYDRVVSTGDIHVVLPDRMGIYYHRYLCRLIAGDVDLNNEVEKAVQRLKHSTKPSAGTFPTLDCAVDPADRTIEVGGVILTPRAFGEILASVNGRGVVLNFKGYVGEAPKWLKEQVLIPGGYSVKSTPKAQ